MISLNTAVSGVRGMSAVSLSHLALEQSDTEQNTWQWLPNCPSTITSNKLQ